MLERMKAILRDRKTDGDKGFSLVELAVVVVIIGILVAIAVPIFFSLTAQAEENTLKAAAANGASIVAVNIASSQGAYDNVDSAGGDGIIVAQKTGAAAGMDTFCVVAYKGEAPVTPQPGNATEAGPCP